MGNAIILLDDDQDFLESFADYIKVAFDRECAIARSLAELTQLGAAVQNSSLAILDINLGPDQPSGVDAYLWLMEQRFAGRVVFLTGHARSHPLVHRAHQLDGVRVFGKPVSLEEIGAIVGGTA